MYHGRNDWEGKRESKRWSCEGEVCHGRDNGKGEGGSKIWSCEGVDVSSLP